MKTILKIQLVALLPLFLVLSSCFDDKGNYDYVELPSLEIDTVGIGMRSEMTAFQFEKFNLPVKIKYAGDKDNLTYEWKLYPQNPSKDDDAPEYDPPVILSTKSELDTIIYATPDRYYLTLTVREKDNEISHFLRIKLNVETKLSRGMVILDEKNGKYDLNLIRTSTILTDMNPEEDNTYYSLFSGVNDILVENGKFLGYASAINMLYFFTQDGGYRLNESTFEIISDDYKSWFSFPMSIKGAPKAYMQTSRPMQMLIDNGLVYKWDHMSIGITSFGDRLDGDYKAASFLPRISTSTFATVIFDTKNKRFASINQFGTNVGVFPSTAGSAFDLNNIGPTKDLLFMDNGFNEYTYSIFKDTQLSNYDLYVADFSGSGAFPVAIYSMKDCPEVNENSKFTFANRGNVSFYSSGSNIYQYKYASINTADVVHSFSGETITSLKVFKQSNHSKDGRLLIVSTESNNNGKVYLIEFNELNGELKKETLRSFDGFGKVIDILIK